MKIMTTGLLVLAGLGMMGCQTTTERTQSVSHVPVCENPHDQRDEWLAGMMKRSDTEVAIQEIKEVYLRRGSDLEKSGSYKAVVSLMTGRANPDGEEETANYKVCFDRFSYTSFIPKPEDFVLK